jgi:hypothetical protein
MSATDRPRPDGRAGLCASCVHARVVSNDRGSQFFRCERSSTDPRFPRYPHLPVTSCVGWEPSKA